MMLDRCGRHKCVIGVGVDIEWHRSNNPDLGDPVTDELARTWLAAVRSHNPSYRMFLKHFRENVMPPTVRDGLMFVDDSQIFKSADEMIDEFAKWGKTFAPAPVGFQYGYQADKPWWGQLDIVIVRNQAEALIESILLCPGFTHRDIAEIVEATENRVAVCVARGDGPSSRISLEALKRAGVL